MAASRSSRVTRSSVGLNGLDENFCGRTLRNRSIAQPEETSASLLPRARSPKKKQDAKQESKQEIKQDLKQESNQAAKQNTKQDAKQNTKQDVKQDTKPEAKQEPKPNTKQEPKQYTKQDDKQDTHLQDGQQLCLLDGKRTETSASLTETDQWSSSRKRGVFCLEKNVDPDNSENCDKGKRVQEAFPQIKRAKRCSRSGDSQVQEEDPRLFKPENLVSDSSKDNSCEELPIQNSANAALALPLLSEEERTEGQVEDGLVECDGATQPQNTHKASNGLNENKVEESSTVAEQYCASPSSVTNCSSLLNGSQLAVPSNPDPTVPCRSSGFGQIETSGSGETRALSPKTFEGAAENLVPELIVAKEQEIEEMEVDVVGDHLCLAREEQVVEQESDENGLALTPPTPVQEAETVPMSSSSTITTNGRPINSNSGETTPPYSKSPSLTEPGCNSSISSMSPSFTELYEHRYTLRTSPRRAASSCKASSSKPGSPPRDNGSSLEEGEVVVGLDECPAKEEPAPFDSVCPISEELVSVEPGDSGGAVDEDGGSAEAKEVESSKELTQSQAAEEQDEEEEDEPDVYYFESDHLALKHNKDYQRLLQTIGVLEAQRTQAIVDLEMLTSHQKDALSDPISFVEQLQKQVSVGLPCPQRVVQLPDIAWEQYTSGLGDFEREFCDKKQKTRQLKLIFDKGLTIRPKSPFEPKREGETSTMYSSLPTSDAPENGRQSQMIRGRICHPNKSDTFNQLWTVEEQRKLEQLLVKFPPEEIESRRWQKIADELGNRTAKQVASRVQKYFIKLTKAGIPVPGRTPNLCMYTKKASNKRQHHLNKHLYRPSTFLASYEPPVYMDEEDERSLYYNNVQDPSADDSDDDGVPVELRNLPEYKELLELKRLKKQKLQELQEDNSGVRHLGYKCDVCGVDPIQGVRWHCHDCPPDNSVDFCSNCSDCLYKTETHKPHHHLEPVYHHEAFVDRDYCLPQSTGYNYLDPNYFPANR
ncbi:ZZ-type zinc finger-containing protein 3 isoform X2 [Gouania willdenowi]|uniref:ZZ-type zinc finger-containing protein 3 isoform X2 n=1 Tax=Gouania willdenowi TaxID=441366 RepID=UPI00105466A2|nr:ZZ-type zinc finger-containing protein 3 isoform X2 [Gouania willdenowi]